MRAIDALGARDPRGRWLAAGVCGCAALAIRGTNEPYRFKDASTLLRDFMNDVEAST